jgi:hypothetical protein
MVPEYVPVISNFSIPPLGFVGVTVKPTIFAVLVSKFRRDWLVLGVLLVWIAGPLPPPPEHHTGAAPTLPVPVSHR